MTRSRVLLPQPDGPMRLTNSPLRISRSIPERAVVALPLPAVKVLSTPAMRTTTSLAGVVGSVMRWRLVRGG